MKKTKRNKYVIDVSVSKENYKKYLSMKVGAEIVDEKAAGQELTEKGERLVRDMINPSVIVRLALEKAAYNVIPREYEKYKNV